MRSIFQVNGCAVNEAGTPQAVTNLVAAAGPQAKAPLPRDVGGPRPLGPDAQMMMPMGRAGLNVAWQEFQHAARLPKNLNVDDQSPAEVSTKVARLNLGVAEAATSLAGIDGARATQDLMAAREALERSPHLPSLAAAFQAVCRAHTACPEVASKAVAAAARAMQDCLSWHVYEAAPRDRNAFIAKARDAFGDMEQEVRESLLEKLLESYSKGPALQASSSELPAKL